MDGYRQQVDEVAKLVLQQLATIRMPAKVWLTTNEAGQYLSLDAEHLQKLRKRGSGPAFEQQGPRVVRYHVDALDAWLRAGRGAA